MTYRISSAHDEGGERVYAVNTTEIVGDHDGNVRALRLVEVDLVDGRFEPRPGTEFELVAELVLLAMGFVGPEHPLLDAMGVDKTERGLAGRDARWRTNLDHVFVAGDMGRGQSLIVWAIAEGRACAAAVDAHLMGSTSLPSPVAPDSRSLA